MANHQGTRWRGNLPIPQHTHPLICRLFSEMNKQMTTVSEVAARSGHCRGTLSDWRYRREPKISDLDAALNVLGLELTVRHKRDEL